MEDVHILKNLTEKDSKRLLRNLNQKKKDFRLELIIYAAIWLVAPLISKPGQRPLIESMGYGNALLFFGVIFLIPLSISYVTKVHRAVTGCQTSMKRVIITSVTGKKKNPAFHKNEYCLKLADNYLKKLYFPKSQYNQYEQGEMLRIEVSENGKQVIHIGKATEEDVEVLYKEDTSLPIVSSNTYSAVLFGSESGKKISLQQFFSLFIPSKENFISTLILDVNIIVFLLMVLSGVSVYKPMVIDLIHWGGNLAPLTMGQHQYWRLITSIFVHVGIIHLLMNMVAFVFVSLFLEGALGRVLFLTNYLITGIGAGLTSVWWHENTVSAGASGAIFGHYGIFLTMLLLVKKEDRKVNMGMIGSVLVFIVYNLIAGLAGGIDNAAHIGGLISGMLMGVMLFLFKHLKNKKAQNKIVPAEVYNKWNRSHNSLLNETQTIQDTTGISKERSPIS